MIRATSLPIAYSRPCQRPQPRRGGAGNTYTVRQGDTLWGISQKTLNDGNRWHEIYDLNRSTISDPNRIVPGMVLKLPRAATPSQPVQPAPPSSSGFIGKAIGWLGKGFGYAVDAIKKLFAAPASGEGAKIASGALKLHNNGYKYPVNLTDRYRYVPGKIGCCADFVCDSYKEAGHDVMADMEAQGYNPHYCPSMIQYFEKHQQLLSASTPVRPGDVVFFDWDGGGKNDPDHVAIVSKVDGNGRPVELIESRHFDKPTEITSMAWNPPDSRAKAIVAIGRLA